ncbi:unnamed protein product [Larinioides sclopetarius]|uniref:THAP-type domain-containing protein n=1 Tax=Larinioides sclopetarius TaxID=280406 RepID=A0AAV1YZJ1_9ARAC
MAAYCCAFNCNEKGTKGSPYSFHRHVCERHFRKEDVLREIEYLDEKSGILLKSSLQYPKLREGAVPMFISDKCPPSLQPAMMASRESPSKKRKRLEDKLVQKAQQASIESVCELHFEPNQVLREASAYDPRTGRTLTAPLMIPRLRKGAVPTLFMPPPGTPAKTGMGPRKLATKRKKNQSKEGTAEEGTESTEENKLVNLLQTDLGTELQNVAGTSVVIKQERDESLKQPPQLVIGTVLGAEELLSSSSNSSFINIALPVPENTFPIANPDSINQTPATDISNKPAQERKINDSKLDANDATLNASQAKLSQRAKSSMSPKRNCKRKLHPPAGTSKKSAVHSTLPTENSETATRDIFQSLLDGSENNPSFGSRTTERPGDLFNVFSDFIADKLREMDWDECAYALRAILDVVFNASKCQHDCKIKSEISSPNNSSGSSDQE